MSQGAFARYTLGRRLELWAQARPGALCVIDALTGASLTYREMYSAVVALRRTLGPEPRRLALALPGGLASAAVWLAALTGGHDLTPIAPDAPALEAELASERSQSHVAFVEREEQGAWPARLAADLWPQARLEAVIESARGERTPEAPLTSDGRLHLFTSGSTGEPKGVTLSASQVAWTAEQVRLSHRLTPDDCGLTALPFFHVNAPVVSLCASVMAGASVVIAPRFSLSHYWEWVERYRVTWASLVPTMIALLLRADRPAAPPGSLRFVRTASAPLPVAHLLEFEERFGVPVIETYGLTEAASMVCANPVAPGLRKPGSVGAPVGARLRVCAPLASGAPAQLRDEAPGNIGEICVRGPGLIRAYDGDVGAQAFQDGWFRTGDLGYQDTDGDVYLTGRLRDVIIRGGENVAPREVEEALLHGSEIVEVAVIGRPDALYGEQVVAYVVSRSVWAPAIEAQARAVCAERLSAHKRPAEYIALSALPRTATGKVDRPRLRWMWAQRAGYEEPDGEAAETRAG